MKRKSFPIIIITLLFFLIPQKSRAYYGLPYGGSSTLYGIGYTPGLLGNYFNGIYGLYGGFNSNIYGLGNFNTGLGFGTGLYGGFYGLGGLYGGLYGLGNLYGFGNLYTPFNLGLYNFDGLFGLSGLYGGLYGLSSLGGLLSTLGVDPLLAGLIFNAGRSDTGASSRSAAAIVEETWVGQWFTVNSVPLPALPISGILSGPMKLSVIKDLVFGTASGIAILEGNTYLSLGVNLTGTASYGLINFQGDIQAPLVPGGTLSVKIVCIQDTATHMSGTYEIYSFFTGYYKVFESGTFDLNLVPTVI